MSLMDYFFRYSVRLYYCIIFCYIKEEQNDTNGGLRNAAATPPTLPTEIGSNSYK